MLLPTSTSILISSTFRRYFGFFTDVPYTTLFMMFHSWTRRFFITSGKQLGLRMPLTSSSSIRSNYIAFHPMTWRTLCTYHEILGHQHMAKIPSKPSLKQSAFKAKSKQQQRSQSIPPKCRAIAEVLLRCFLSKTDGRNQISHIMHQMMFALINGYNFDYTGYIFEAIKKQLMFNFTHPADGSSIYPRFISLIIQQLMRPAYTKVRPSQTIEAEKLTKHF